mgnify:FL=1
MKCSICGGPIDEHRHPETGEVYWTEGHNAEPVNDGRCCTVCNDSVVISRRMTDIVQAMKADTSVEDILKCSIKGEVSWG